MRTDGTGSVSESLYLAAIHRRGTDGFKVTPQRWFYRFRVDFSFVHPDGRRMAVEIDGPEHDARSQREVDECRDQALSTIGVETLRISNRRVTRDADECAITTAVFLGRQPRLTGEQVARFDAVYRKRCAALFPDWLVPKLTVLDAHGEQEAWDAFDVFNEQWRQAARYIDKTYHDRAYREVHRAIRGTPRLHTRAEIERLHAKWFTRKREEHRATFSPEELLALDADCWP